MMVFTTILTVALVAGCGYALVRVLAVQKDFEEYYANDDENRF